MNAAFYVCDAHAEDKSKVAIFSEDYTGKTGKLTFWELKNITNKLANYFQSKGLKKGDCVAVCLSQRPEAIISHIGIWKFGGMSMPLTVLFGPDGLRYRLEHSGAKMAIVEESALDNLRAIKDELKELQEILVVGDVKLEKNEFGFWGSIDHMSRNFSSLEVNSTDNMILL